MTSSKFSSLAGLTAEQLLQLNTSYQQSGVTPLSAAVTIPFSAAASEAPKLGWRHRLLCQKPTVSIVVASQSSDEITLGMTLASLQAQSWQRLQILVVIDGQHKPLQAVAERFASKDQRITILPLQEAVGHAAALNEGFDKARGQLVLFLPEPLWLHPQLISTLAQPLLDDKSLQLCAAKAAVVDEQSNQLVLSELSSVFLFRRSVKRKLGFFDQVTAGFMQEYVARWQHWYSPGAVPVPVLAPLAIALQPGTSQQSQHRVNRYLTAAAEWHHRSGSPFLAKWPASRPFAAPAALCCGSVKVRQQRQLDVLLQSDLFDPEWYLATYHDVAKAGMKPALHYLRYGGLENRDPGPNFSSSGYRLQHNLASTVNPLVHYLERLEEPGGEQEYGCVQFAGACDIRPDSPWLLVAAHAAGPDLYGAERSLLDVLKALQALELNVLVTLPGVRSEAYLAQVQAQAQQLAILPYRWWYQGRQECEQTIVHFKKLMQQYRPALCYCNTLVLSEPLHAARQLLIPGIVHVRELPAADEALCAELGADAGQIRSHLLALADGFIANSQATADYLAAPERTTVMANVVDVERFAQIPPRVSPVPLRLGMISSNLPKKGLQDFVRLSQLLAARQVPVECWLIGPDNHHTAQLKADQAAGRLAPSLHIAGYAASPEEALAPLDLVVNLSHFQESFGRTVLEAMAARRVVVCYRWGALPELVRHEQTGLLADFGDIEAVATAVARLVEDKPLRQRMSSAAYQQVVSAYSTTALQQQLAQWLVVQGITQQEVL